MALVVAYGFVDLAYARKTHLPGSGIPTSIRHFEPVTGLSLQRSRERSGGAAKRGSFSVSWRTLGRHFYIEMEPNEIFASRAKVVWIGADHSEEQAPEQIFYRGRLEEDSNSWVRMTVRNGVLDGLIWTPEEIYFVEPATRFFPDANPREMLAYRLSDTDSEWLPGSCAVQSALETGTGTSSGAAAYQRLASTLVQLAGATLQQGEIGLVGDHEYFQRHGSTSAADMHSIINQVDGVYQSEVGASLKIARTVVYTTSDDPFSSTTDPRTLLNEFAAYKASSDSPIFGTDLAHLFTGRDLAGMVVGIGTLGSVCSGYRAVALSQDFSTNNKAMVLLAAHEIGHNFNAPHDNEAGSPCGFEPWGYIMNPGLSVNLNLQFSGCSKTFIGNEVASVSCLETLVVDTPTPSPSPTSTIISTPSRTKTSTWTHTPSPTATATRTPTITRTPSATRTLPPTRTPTPTWSLTPTRTPSQAPTPTYTETGTPTHTPTVTATGTSTPPLTGVLCPAVPLTGCRKPVTSRKASILIKDAADDKKDKIIWKWVRGEATDADEFGNPVEEPTAYELCLYERKSGTVGLAMGAYVPGGALCSRSSPCWGEHFTGFRYRNQGRSHDGILKIDLRHGAAGRAKILVKGKGFNLPMPKMPLSQDPAIIVQLVNSDGYCWEATYSSPASVKRVDRFADKAD